MTSPRISERTIMKKRACKHCGMDVYLQYLPVTTTFRWIAFDIKDGKLHECRSKPLDFMTRKLIHEAINRMNYNTNTTNISLKEEIIHNIDTMITCLSDIKKKVLLYQINVNSS